VGANGDLVDLQRIGNRRGCYIGSHVALALLDAGHRVTVIDDLSTGFRWAVPADASFFEDNVADRALVSRLIGEQEIDAIMHFAGSIIVPESVSEQYVGTLIYNRVSEELQGRTKKNDPSEWIRVPNAFPAIVEPKLKTKRRAVGSN
jgi:hypothetical protein